MLPYAAVAANISAAGDQPAKRFWENSDNTYNNSRANSNTINRVYY
jgi:hypothetical protein